MIIPFLW